MTEPDTHHEPTPNRADEVDDGLALARYMNAGLKERLAKILAGRGASDDLEYLQALGETVTIGSRCGLGQTSANPILSTLASFRDEYETRIAAARKGTFLPRFDIRQALAESESIAGRESVIFAEE